MNTTIEMTTTETSPTTAPATLAAWTTGAGLGPIMAGKFNKAERAVSWNARGVTELRGIHGKPETQRDSGCVMVSMFGGPTHPEYLPKMLALQAEHGSQVNAANYKALVADLEELAAWFSDNPMVKDLRETQEEHDAKEAKYSQARQAQDSRQEAARQAENLETEQMRKLYPWAKRDGSDRARGSANLKTLLGQKFPGIVFSVSSDSGSMTSSINVRWVNGPTMKEVDAIADQFQEADFDGSTDSTNYRSTGAGFRNVMGSAKYVSSSRDSSGPRAVVEAAILAFRPDDAEGKHGHWSANQIAYRVMEQTSLPPGAVVKGIEQDDSTDGFKVTFEAGAGPGEVPAPVVAADGGVSVTQNEGKDGVEIRFISKPGEEVIRNLKAHGFRWAFSSRCWYAKRSPAKLAYAYELAGVAVPATEEAAQ